MSNKERQAGTRRDPDRDTIKRWVEMANGESGVRVDKIAEVREAIRLDRYDVSQFLDEAIERLEDDMDTALVRESDAPLQSDE